MELNREQIIKALECCTCGRGENGEIPCPDCPYEECNIVGGTSERQTKGSCVYWLKVDALSLINELTEENETLGAEKEHLELVVEGKLKRTSALEKQVLSLAEENVRLREKLVKTYNVLDKSINFYCSFTQSKVSNCPIDDEIAKAKADTVRKMQERLKAQKFTHKNFGELVYVEDIDQIANEMLENADDK